MESGLFILFIFLLHITIFTKRYYYYKDFVIGGILVVITYIF